MTKLKLQILILVLLTEMSAGSMHSQPTATWTKLFSSIWRVQYKDSPAAPGSIYVFLPNGTLLESSCGEKYRIATWSTDKKALRVLRVVEDGQLAFTASIIASTRTTVTLQQALVRSGEKRELALSAVEKEFVCPDSP